MDNTVLCKSYYYNYHTGLYELRMHTSTTNQLVSDVIKWTFSKLCHTDVALTAMKAYCIWPQF